MRGGVCGRTRVQGVASGGVVVFGGDAHAHRRIIVDPLARARGGHKVTDASQGQMRASRAVHKPGSCTLHSARGARKTPASTPIPVRPRTSPLNGVMFHEPSFAVSAMPGGCKHTIHVIARMALDAASPASPLDFGEAAQRGKLGQTHAAQARCARRGARGARADQKLEAAEADRACRVVKGPDRAQLVRLLEEPEHDRTVGAAFGRATFVEELCVTRR
jgi:hypothetical protein